jgi:hypothetical protein
MRNIPPDILPGNAGRFTGDGAAPPPVCFARVRTRSTNPPAILNLRNLHHSLIKSWSAFTD